MPSRLLFCVFFFFFKAEDGIRNKLVTGVKTCALPIPTPPASGAYSVSAARSPAASSVSACRAMACIWSGRPAATGWAPGTPTRRVCVTHAASTANAKDAARLTAIQALQHGPAQEWDQNLVVSGELDAAPAALRGPLHAVDARAVVALHVAVARGE